MNQNEIISEVMIALSDLQHVGRTCVNAEIAEIFGNVVYAMGIRAAGGAITDDGTGKWYYMVK